MSTRETNISQIADWLEAHELEMAKARVNDQDVQAGRLKNAERFYDLIRAMKEETPT